ncbi:MAG: hypothetical protein NVSMB14_02210 [Isosphaeraceae bacterium]
MSASERETTLVPLELPREFEDLEGLVRADLRAIVAMVGDRARDRLLLSRKQCRHLQKSRWTSLVEALKDAVEPLTAEQH